MRLYIRELANDKKPCLITAITDDDYEETLGFPITVDLYGWSENVFLCMYNSGDIMELSNAVAVNMIPISIACDRVRAIREQSRNGYMSPESLILDNKTGTNTIKDIMQDIIESATRAMLVQAGLLYKRTCNIDTLDWVIEMDNRYETYINNFTDSLIDYLINNIPTLSDAKAQGMFDESITGLMIKEWK